MMHAHQHYLGLSCCAATAYHNASCLPAHVLLLLLLLPGWLMLTAA
jgi:hypothetical protein